MAPSKALILPLVLQNGIEDVTFTLISWSNVLNFCLRAKPENKQDLVAIFILGMQLILCHKFWKKICIL